MKRKSARIAVFVGVVLSVLAVLALAGQDKYSVKVPGGLAFSEFKGYEAWQAISISRNEKVMAMILGNPLMIDAYRAGIPGNGEPFPDGAKMAKLHWAPKPNAFFPDATVPGKLLNVDFMVKDSKRFADSGGWGYAVFDYDAASETFTPGTSADKPPQGNDAKCGFASYGGSEKGLRLHGVRVAVRGKNKRAADRRGTRGRQAPGRPHHADGRRFEGRPVRRRPSLH